MPLSRMHEAVRIADHLCGPRDVESIERQGRLQNTIVLFFMFHMVMVVAFVSLRDLEVTHPQRSGCNFRANTTAN